MESTRVVYVNWPAGASQYDLEPELRQRFRGNDGVEKTPEVVYDVTIRARWKSGRERVGGFLQFGFENQDETVGNLVSGVLDVLDEFDGDDDEIAPE